MLQLSELLLLTFEISKRDDQSVLYSQLTLLRAASTFQAEIIWEDNYADTFGTTNLAS